MSTTEGLLAELGALATALGPTVTPPGTEGLLSSLTETARQLFGAQACSLALLSDDESELVYTIASGAGAQETSGMRMPSGQGIAGWVVASGQPVAIADVRNDSRFARNVAEQSGYVPTAILAAPVASPVRLLGVLTLLDRDASRPGADQDLQLLGLFADQAALALESARVFSDLGRVLLSALAQATTGGELTDALATASATVRRPERALTELAQLFADLAARGPREHDLALQVVRDVIAYTQRKP